MFRFDLGAHSGAATPRRPSRARQPGPQREEQLMTSRVTTKSPDFGRGSLRFAAVMFAILAGGVAADPVSAAPTSVTTRPEFPAVCDTVGLIVAGTMPAPSPCYNIIGRRSKGPPSCRRRDRYPRMRFGSESPSRSRTHSST